MPPEELDTVDFNGKVLTNVNVKILTERLGLRGRQEHYDAYVEDLVIRQQSIYLPIYLSVSTQIRTLRTTA